MAEEVGRVIEYLIKKGKLQDIIEEASRMASFKHPHLVKLLGISFADDTLQVKNKVCAKANNVYLDRHLVESLWRPSVISEETQTKPYRQKSPRVLLSDIIGESKVITS